MKEVKIIEFNENFKSDFARLNYEWIEELFAIEPHDREILDNPVEYIINNGGQIFFAILENKAVGTVALINFDEDSFELAKMGVSPELQGHKIGHKLMEACLNYAKYSTKNKVFLLSNRKLVPALSLYKKFGFVEVPLDPENQYERTDIQMELLLK